MKTKILLVTVTSLFFLLSFLGAASAATYTYTHDNLDRVTGIVSDSGSMQIAYTYDNVGNRLSMAVQKTTLGTPSVTVPGDYSIDSTTINLDVNKYGPEYGILTYYYALGTACGLTDIKGWIQFTPGANGSVRLDSLSLPYGLIFVSIRVENYLGEIVSETGCSNGIRVIDPLGDEDGDGYTNEEEHQSGTDPFDGTSNVGPFTVVSVSPLDGTAGVSRTPAISANIRGLIDEANLSGNEIRATGSFTGPVSGTLSYNPSSSTLSFVSDNSLALGETIEVVLSGDLANLSGITLDGNNNGANEGSPADDYVWTFHVGKSDGLNVRITDVFSNDCTTIQAAVIVTDGSGTQVTDLPGSDFTVYENGAIQSPITAEFKDLSGLAASVSLALDYSGSMSVEARADMEMAAAEFISNMLADDEVEVIKFAKGFEVTQGFTTDKTALLQAVQATPAIPLSATALYDAINQAVTDTAERNGRRAVVIMTDGKDNDSSVAYQDVIASARYRGVPVFTIGLGTEIQIDILDEIAGETGGLYLESPTSADLQGIYQDISRMLKNQYIVTYNTSRQAGEDITLRIEAARGPSGGIDISNYTICSDNLDMDNDGVPSAEEDAGPNSGDGNSDGLLDSQQGDVASAVVISTGGYATVDVWAAGNNSALTGVATTTESALGEDPLYDYPVGLVKFVMNNTMPGFSETVRIYFHGVADLTEYEYRKFDPNTATWYTLQDVFFGAEVIGGELVAFAELPLVDGGEGDADLAVNGIIVDLASGPALPALDSDGDGIADIDDNCTKVSNPNQRDTDGDGFGNICDPDFNGDNVVNFADLAQMKSVFFSTSRPNQDLNGDGAVNFGDLAILKSYFFREPGPSGLEQ